jgi:hypothetical protein
MEFLLDYFKDPDASPFSCIPIEYVYTMVNATKQNVELTMLLLTVRVAAPLLALAALAAALCAGAGAGVAAAGVDLFRKGDNGVRRTVRCGGVARHLPLPLVPSSRAHCCANALPLLTRSSIIYLLCITHSIIHYRSAPARG